MADSDYEHNPNEYIFIDPTKIANNDINMIKKYIKSSNLRLAPNVHKHNVHNNKQKIKKCNLGPVYTIFSFVLNIIIFMIILYAIYSIITYIVGDSSTNNDNFDDIVRTNKIFTLRESTQKYRIN